MINFQMVPVQGGTFVMGSTDGYADEWPVHQVTLSNFYIGKFTVIQREWEAVMDSNPSVIKGNELPVTNVSWNDVQEFIQKLNTQTGKQYRLPTEAEWEYAARGGNQSNGFEYAGSGHVDEVAWHRGNSSDTLFPVGQKKPNELGLYDMSGNIWEWCEDWYGEYSSSAQTNPIGPNTGSYRVFRGGSWDGIPQYCRVADRAGNSSDYYIRYLGFRLAHDFETFNQPEKSNSNMEQTIETNHDFQKSQGYIKAAIFKLFHDRILELTNVCTEYVKATNFSVDGLISGSSKGWEDSDIVNMSDTLGYFKDDAYKLGHMVQRVEKLIDCVDKSSDLASLFVYIDECKYVWEIDFPGSEYDKVSQKLIDTIVEAYQSSK